MQASFVGSCLTLRPAARMTMPLPMMVGGGRAASLRVPTRLPALWIVSAKGAKGPSRQRKRKQRQGKTTKDSSFAEETLNTSATSTPSDLAKQFVAQQSQEVGQAVSRSVSSDVDFDSKLAALKSSAPPGSRRGGAAEAPLSAPSQYDGFLSGSPSAAATTADEETGPRLWVQIGAAVIVGVFVFLYSGSELQQMTGVRKGGGGGGGSAELSPELKVELQAEAAKFEALLAADKSDAEAVEGAAVTYARLGDFKAADAQLERLLLLKPADVEVLRLLAETRAQQGDLKGSGERYLQALALSPDNLELLRAYMTILSNDGKQAAAIDVLQEIRPRALERGNLGVEGSASDPIDIVQLELLAGKVYADWKGHSADAMATYDGLMASYKEDFRGYLAKGALLKELGRAKDADRMFLQARYLAPDSAKALVEQVRARPAPSS